MGNRNTCAPTEIETHRVGRPFAVTAPSGPRSSTTPFSPTAVCAKRVRYGPKSVPTTVVKKAELAQSYIFQPKISRLSFLSLKVPLRLSQRPLRLCGEPALAEASFVIGMKETTLAIKIELVVE